MKTVSTSCNIMVTTLTAGGNNRIIDDLETLPNWVNRLSKFKMLEIFSLLVVLSVNSNVPHFVYHNFYLK